MRKFCLIALFIASYLTIGAQKCFQYPFNQGDAKWKTFSSSKERIVALQIPPFWRICYPPVLSIRIFNPILSPLGQPMSISCG